MGASKQQLQCNSPSRVEICHTESSTSVSIMQNATEELKRLESAFNAVRQNIFTRLHDVVRDQIFLPQPGDLIPESSSHLPEAATLAESESPAASTGVSGQAGNGSGNGARLPHQSSNVKQ